MANGTAAAAPAASGERGGIRNKPPAANGVHHPAALPPRRGRTPRTRQVSLSSSHESENGESSAVPTPEGAGRSGAYASAPPGGGGDADVEGKELRSRLLLLFARGGDERRPVFDRSYGGSLKSPHVPVVEQERGYVHLTCRSGFWSDLNPVSTADIFMFVGLSFSPCFVYHIVLFFFLPVV